MKTGQNLIAGVCLGAGAMYLLDPRAGRRRRAMIRDKTIHNVKRTGHAIDVSARDLKHRTEGLVAETRSRLNGSSVEDDVLVSRVRSRMGRSVSHPHAIEVTAENGRVTVSGPILQDEVSNFLSAVHSIPGVEEIEDHLEVHKSRGDIPALQGGSRRIGDRFELMQSNWAPSARMLVGGLGSWLALYGSRRRDTFGAALSTLGLGLFGRSLTNLEFSKLIGVGGGRRAIDIQKTIEVAAPIDEVYEFWTRFENFPQFMTHLREVKNLEHGRSRWIAAGPAGIPIQWEAVMTGNIPNELVAWKSVENSIVDNAGRIRFERTGDDRTRIHIQMSYNPPGGVIGHLVASIFGSDPKHAMNDDMIRFKSLIENGKTHANGRRVTREALFGNRRQAFSEHT